MNANGGGVAHQRWNLGKAVHRAKAEMLFNVLTGTELLESVERLSGEFRERLYPPIQTLSMYTAQSLRADRSCQRAVDEFNVWRLETGLTSCSWSTGGYCRARARLKEDMIQALGREIAILQAGSLPPAWRWLGHRLRGVDGTTITMPDTQDNQREFPQQSGQAAGLGFPICRVVALMCLHTGMVLDAAIGPYQGKGSGESSLLRQISGSLHADDLLLGDALYPSWWLLHDLLERQVHGLFEQHGARRATTDFRTGKRLGKRDHLTELPKPERPEWMTKAQYETLPASIVVREFAHAQKVLVTTLADDKRYAKAELGKLYQQRWKVELNLRDIKTTMGMEHLSCRQAKSVRTQLRVYLLAYNIVRLSMARAAQEAHLLPQQISFKHAMHICALLSAHISPHAVGLAQSLAPYIVGRPLTSRPGRVQPRCVKRRPKPFPLLNQPRAQAVARIRAHGHPKRAK